MRLLVTGASGHVGGAIARHFAERDHEIVGLSRHAAEGLPSSIDHVCADIGAEDFVQRVSEVVSSCEAVVHAAANIGVNTDDAEIERVNRLGTQHILALAEAWNCRHFVFISTVAVYGEPGTAPIAENRPTNPLTVYAASKLHGEQLVAAASSDAMTGTSLRIPSPVGPGLRNRRIFSIFVERALAGGALMLNGTGALRQSYVDVRDVAAAVEAAALRSSGGVFNIGGQKALSNLELAEACVRILGAESSTIAFSGEPDPEDGMCWDLSSQMAKEQLGYEPRYDIEDSIRALAHEKGVHPNPC